MDPSHRDRLAFARICSGRFERGMTVTCDRTGRELDDEVRHHRVRRRPRDGRGGLPRRRRRPRQRHRPAARRHDLRRGRRPVTFPPIPRFSPEVFATARPLDTGRAKQFRRGLEQLDEEGVVQVLRDPDIGDSGADPRRRRRAAVRGVRPPAGQRVQRPGRDPQRRLPGDPPHRPGVGRPAARDRRHPHPAAARDGALVALFENRYRLARLEADEPELTLEPLVAGAIPVA